MHLCFSIPLAFIISISCMLHAAEDSYRTEIQWKNKQKEIVHAWRNGRIFRLPYLEYPEYAYEVCSAEAPISLQELIDTYNREYTAVTTIDEHRAAADSIILLIQVYQALHTFENGCSTSTPDTEKARWLELAALKQQTETKLFGKAPYILEEKFGAAASFLTEEWKSLEDKLEIKLCYLRLAQTHNLLKKTGEIPYLPLKLNH